MVLDVRSSEGIAISISLLLFVTFGAPEMFTYYCLSLD